MLLDPVAYGGKEEDAFHVVAPSIPGYGFSSAPKEKGFDQVLIFFEVEIFVTAIIKILG